MKSHSSQVSRRRFLMTSGATAAALISPNKANAATRTGVFDAGAADEHVMGVTNVQSQTFSAALPIWPAGREKEMNLMVGFRAVVEAPATGSVLLSLVCSCLYRTWINGEFHAWGPARGPHGHYRVDGWDITSLLVLEQNLICIEVAGYNINSYWIVNQPSFLQAEVRSGGTVLAATGHQQAPFHALILPERVQKVQRYSFQRAFSEIYQLTTTSALWRTRIDAKPTFVSWATASQKQLLPRRVALPKFVRRVPRAVVSTGTFHRAQPKSFIRDRSLTDIGPKLLGFKEAELAEIPSQDLQKLVTDRREVIYANYAKDERLSVSAGEFKILDLGVNLSGFLGLQIQTKSKTTLYLAFDEQLTEGDVDSQRLQCVNAVTLHLEPGTHSFEAFEPYTLRYLKLIVTEGWCDVRDIYLREYAAPDVWTASFSSSDDGLNTLFSAGRETYRQNAVDLFSDCPSRERAGYLCDSYFTAQAAVLLSGHTRVEHNFLENYLLGPQSEYLPDGMLPMCYPADHNDGMFIPNWSLWFVLQLETYLGRGGDPTLVEALRPRIVKLFAYFKKFENSDGLVEKLENWVFVEWSDANKYVQDVNYPSNMLYAAALAVAGKLYSDDTLVEKARLLKETIRRQSFDGAFFVDNALRQDGQLVRTRNCTETCQYYAFFLGTASFERDPDLWQKLVTSFGPRRTTTNAYPEIAPSNAFIGDVLRLQLLSRAGLSSQILEETRDYLLYMAEKTGTLWENQTAVASLDHGFTSLIVAILYRDVLGVYKIDFVTKHVSLRFRPSGLRWCRGQIPTTDGFISMSWTKNVANELNYKLDLPFGYTVSVENTSGMKLHTE